MEVGNGDLDGDALEEGRNAIEMEVGYFRSLLHAQTGLPMK